MNTEERILKAFKEMARYQGINAIRMEELAARAGVTKKTIYNYFTGKKDLVEKTVDGFISEVVYQVESVMTKSDLIESIAAPMEHLLKEGAFLFNIQSLKDLQIYYPETWQKILEFRISMVSSVVDIIFKRTRKKWVLEMDPRIIREALLAINNRFATPEFAVEMGMPVEELTSQFARLSIYPYL